MCGIVGFWHFNQSFPNNLSQIASAMADKLIERGPDSGGVWQDSEFPLALAHRRLSIQDLSVHGAQPMLSICERWAIIYNGEIYNADDLGDDLKNLGVKLRGYSDTEVLINAIALFGIDKTLARINGMFAFAAWDRQEKKLYLIRDRVGIKPLYWGFNKGVLYFGSQLKAFFQHPNFAPQIDRDALVSYFRFNYVPGPVSIYSGIEKLNSGEYVIVDASGNVERKRYWSILESGEERNWSCEQDAISELDILLKDAVSKCMVSDVPLGAFLSGGIDSSTVVALMQVQSSRPIKTFSIGFNETGYNEAQYAKKVAAHLGTEHHELYLSSEDAIQLIPNLPKWYDEPFADSSQLPTFLVSQLAKQHVTVSLSGDGGDELFAGYSRYLVADNIFKKIAVVPQPLRNFLARFILSVKPQHWNKLSQAIPSRLRPNHAGDKAHKFGELLRGQGKDFYKQMMSMWQQPELLVDDGVDYDRWPVFTEYDFIQKMQLLDIATYLPDDILTKVDRASMAVSLEARVPLLDYRVAEYAFRLPAALKVKNNQGKWILRQVLKKYVPDELIDRPKMGFGVPIGDWMRGALREWCEELLSQNALQKSGLNVQLIQNKWNEHLSGARNWQYPLWGVLMYQAWLNK